MGSPLPESHTILEKQPSLKSTKRMNATPQSGQCLMWFHSGWSMMAGSSASSNSRCDSTCDSFTSSLLIRLKLVSQVWWALGHITSPDYYGIVNGSLRESSATRAVTNGSVETQTKKGSLSRIRARSGGFPHSVVKIGIRSLSQRDQVDYKRIPTCRQKERSLQGKRLRLQESTITRSG
jgi:hypothetical protein